MSDQSPTLRTPRLLLRPLTVKDRDEYLIMWRQSEEFFHPWFPAREGTLTEQFKLELEKTGQGLEAGTHFRMAGFRDDGRMVGFFALNEIIRGYLRNAYTGWCVGKEFAGQGYAAEGVRAVLDYAFAPDPGLNLHRIQANIMPENERSIHLAERMGFRREGLAERYLLINGLWRDHLMFAKTAEEHLPEL